MADAKDAAREAVEKNREALVDLSHRIHANPELGFEEERAAPGCGEPLDAAGFAVERGVGDLPTAFAATRRLGPAPRRRSAPSTTPCRASATPAATT